MTLFDGNNMQDAIDASVDGDTIYLTLGTFKSFSINKKITIRGTGENTVINGSVIVEMPGSQHLTSTIMEDLAISGTVKFNSNVSNLRFHKCKIMGTLNLSGNVNEGTIKECKIEGMTFGGSIDNFYIDRCYISSLTLSSTIMGMTVVNTKLKEVKASSAVSNNLTFVNCNIYALFTSNFEGTIINSIIQSPGNQNAYRSFLYELNTTVLINTVINTYHTGGSDNCRIGNSCVTQNCYFVNKQDYVSSTCDSSPNSSYIGTDGTIVGIYGGNTPYTGNLTPSVPKVTSSNLYVDKENKILNVKLTVSPR